MMKKGSFGGPFFSDFKKKLDMTLGRDCILLSKEGEMTMEKKSKKKVAIFAALVVIALMTAYLVAIIIPLARESLGERIAIAILVIYGAVILAGILGVSLALKQRLKEIESGEEDEAKRY